MILGGDISNISQPISITNIPINEETVTLTQNETRVEAKMPWKGENGLTISYDIDPTITERLLDGKLDRQIVTNVVNGGNGFKVDILLFKKPDTNKFCYTINGWEDYSFEWQPPLTMEKESGETCTDTQCVNKKGQITKSRPIEIVGSYAIYSKTKYGYIKGKTNYETGKLGHIPYPYIWEVGKENNKIRAENLSFNNGQLCVTAPQAFLDNADYTNGVRIDPTFGYTSAGASSVLVSANQWYGAKGVPASNGTVDSMTTYTSRPSEGTTSWKGVLVDNSLVILSNGVSDVGTVVSTVASWRTATYTSKPSVTGSSTYFCGIIPNGNFNQFYDTTGAVSGDSKNDTSNSYTTPTNPTDASNLTRLQSTYCTYTESLSTVGESYLFINEY